MGLDDELIGDEMWLNDIGITLFKKDDSEPLAPYGLLEDECIRRSEYSVAALVAGKDRVCAGDLDFLHRYLSDKEVLLFYKVKLFYEFLERSEKEYPLNMTLTMKECSGALQEIRTCTSPIVPYDSERLVKIANEASAMVRDPVPQDYRFRFFHEFFTNMYPNLDVESFMKKDRTLVRMEQQDE